MTTRTKIGIIAVVLLVMGGYFHWFPSKSATNTAALESAGLRIGTVMAVLWLAYPELVKLPTWISLLTLVATPIIAWRPRIALVILPVLLITWMLSPRVKRKPRDE